ncbi:hypothetical protein ACFX2F_039989 [Malus domestica]
MISGYAMQRMAGEEMAVFGFMRGDVEKEEDNEFVLTSVLSALALPEFVDTGKQIHCLSVKNGLIGFVSVENALVTVYGKCGSLDALKTFKLCGDKNSITWNGSFILSVADGSAGQVMYVDWMFDPTISRTLDCMSSSCGLFICPSTTAQQNKHIISNHQAQFTLSSCRYLKGMRLNNDMSVNIRSSRLEGKDTSRKIYTYRSLQVLSLQISLSFHKTFVLHVYKY